MAISQARSRRSASGARLRDYRKKKQYEAGRRPVLTKIGEKQVKTLRVLGGNTKSKLFHEKVANVFDMKKKKTVKATLKNVLENEANRNFIRRNILTKGAIVETDIGKIKITNRPGQEGTINGVLIE